MAEPQKDTAGPTDAGVTLLRQLHETAQDLHQTIEVAHETGELGTECVIDDEGCCPVCEITQLVQGLALELDAYFQPSPQPTPDVDG